jgi:hypothetical protein
VIGVGPRLYSYIAARRRRLYGIGHKSTYVPRVIVASPMLDGRGSYPWILHLFVVTFVVLFCAFAVRLPIAKYFPRLARAAATSQRVFGDMPYAFGLMQVDAFNFPPLSGTLPTFELTWERGDGERRFLFVVPAVRADLNVSDMLFYQTQITFNHMKYDGTCFAPAFAQALMDRIAIKAILHRSEFAGGQFRLSMVAYDIPAADDFLSYRYVPLRFYRVCDATFPAGSLAPLSFSYFQEGIDAMASRSPLPFSVAVEAVPLAQKYPCRAKPTRIAYWFGQRQFAESS